MLNRKYYLQAIEKFKFIPNLDCLASHTNCQIEKYVSLKPDSYASFINAFSINWQDFNFYVFPLFSVIGRLLQKICADKAMALCVFP